MYEMNNLLFPCRFSFIFIPRYAETDAKRLSPTFNMTAMFSGLLFRDLRQIN